MNKEKECGSGKEVCARDSHTLLSSGGVRERRGEKQSVRYFVIIQKNIMIAVLGRCGSVLP